MIRLYVDDAKKEQFRIESDEPVTVITGVTDAGRPVYIFEGVRDDVSLENAEESGYAVKYNPLEPHRFPNDTNLVGIGDKHSKIEIVAEEKDPDPEILTPTIPQTIDEAVSGTHDLLELDLRPHPGKLSAPERALLAGKKIAAEKEAEATLGELRKQVEQGKADSQVFDITDIDSVTEDAEEIPVVGDMTPETTRSISEGNLPVPADAHPPKPTRPQNIPTRLPVTSTPTTPAPQSPPQPARRIGRPAPPTQRPGGGSGRLPRTPPQS